MKLDALEEYCEERAISRGLDHDARAIVEKAREDLAQIPETASLAVFSRVRGFLRTIVLGAVSDHVVDGVVQPRPDWDVEIWREFCVLARRLGVFEAGWEVEEGRLRPSYAWTAAGREPQGQVAADREDYFFMIRFAEEARAETAPVWIRRDDVAYFPWMIDYFREIEGIDFTGRRPMREGTAFCSDLGEMAFVKFTHASFNALLDAVRPGVFLDVGCGEGRHVVAASSHPAVRRALGVEVDPDVAASARARVTAQGGEIVTGDICCYQPDEPVDMAFACYMLFYLEEEQQVDMLRMIREALAPGGVFVLCQYFPDFEEPQEALVEETSGSDALARYVAEVARSCVDAEVLLNRMLAHFRSPVYWAKYRAMLREAGFRLKEILPADPLFYSFYIIAEKG